ncbi:MAG: inositol monophosphatase, partial [Planctomycetes bacterium]|nr:inositol monophosphatase [Planctomycetota bacterium]
SLCHRPADQQSIMRSFMIELAQVGGKIARQHFRSLGHNDTDRKGRNDYVTFVDKNIEDIISTRIHSQYPEHMIIGEESAAQLKAAPDYNGPAWIIDPIDGTTNFVRGIPHFAISIAYCDKDFEPRYAVVYDPIKEEMFYAERNAGTWLNNERVYTSECKTLDQSIVACAAPFRSMNASDDIFTVMKNLQPQVDDIRRIGSSALDLAYTAVGRCDAYWELGIWPWDTAAGELLIRSAGGTVTDFRGDEKALLSRRSIIAAATPELHELIYSACADVRPWADRDPYTTDVASQLGVSTS